MNRRFFIFSSLASLGATATTLITTSKPGVWDLTAGHVSSLVNSPYSVRYKCMSVEHRKNFSSVEDFWSLHKDPVADGLNDLFLKKGWLVSSRSSLSDDGQHVILEKTYKNKYYIGLYKRMWIKAYGGELPLEQRMLRYSEV